MRSFSIEFNAENKLPDGKCLGRKGEQNATELNITLPAEMLNNAEIEGIVIVFQVGAHRVFRSDVHEKAETVNYKLPREVTCANKVDIQLEGYGSSEELIIKSEIVEGLYLDPSVCGEDTSDEISKSLAGEIAANAAARHTHENADVLNALADENGKLTYNGQAIGGASRPTAQKEFTQDDTNFFWWTEGVGTPDIKFFVAFLEADADISNGTEIADVEFMFSNHETLPNDVYISLNEMYGYGNKPYIPLVKKVYQETDSAYIVAAIYFPLGLNTIANAIDAYEWTSARITYYTD